MTIASTFFVPRGLLMIAKLTAGVPGPYRPLAEIWNANYSANSELEPIYSNQDCGPVVAHRDPIGTQPVIEGEVRDWSPANVALAVIGPAAAVTSSTGSHTVAGALTAGDYVVLPHKGISVLSITNDSNPIVKDTDYTEDDMPGGVIKFLTDQTGPVEFDYTYADHTKIEIGGSEADEYEVSLIVKNRAGNCTRQRYTLWSCSITQSGAMDLLAPHDDTDPKPIPLKFLANYVQAKKDAGESGYGEIMI